MAETTDTSDLRALPLDGWHRGRGARMVPFAGYAMPVQYEGVIAEHLWTRESAGLFDVSHMGQLQIAGANPAAALERLLPGDIIGLKPGRVRYSLLLTEDGGIVDDLMVTNAGDHLYVVVNGATKWDDIVYLREQLPPAVEIRHLLDHSLLALQGPRAVDALERLIPGVAELTFMQSGHFEFDGLTVGISRSGYTGEDGFEISILSDQAEALAEALCSQPEVKPIGLGARDSLRLEAGLPLYGHDLDKETTPVMADLQFAISKRRRAEGGFAGAMRILAELENGAAQKRVGFNIEGRQPVREGALVLDGEGNEVGRITSGTFSPSLQRPIAMAYVATPLSAPGTKLTLEQRGKLFQADVTPLPFVPRRYHRKEQPK
jgi:aminomethyltransferase